jgi:chromatin remodeling complex protein RSC6
MEGQETSKVKRNTPLNKLMGAIESLKTKLSIQKKQIDDVNGEIKTIEKMLSKMAEKENKNENLVVQCKRGFAKPTRISEELCDFMNVPNGSLIARTEVTKYINLYIREKELKNKEDKKYIIPDDKLRVILGEEAHNKDITYFNLQKFMNKHFLQYEEEEEHNL